jgi:hypothetical protein
MGPFLLGGRLIRCQRPALQRKTVRPGRLRSTPPYNRRARPADSQLGGAYQLPEGGLPRRPQEIRRIRASLATLDGSPLPRGTDVRYSTDPLTEETSDRPTMTTWSRMTAHSTKVQQPPRVTTSGSPIRTRICANDWDDHAPVVRIERSCVVLNRPGSGGDLRAPAVLALVTDRSISATSWSFICRRRVLKLAMAATAPTADPLRRGRG